MTSPRTNKIIRRVLLIASFIGFFPIAIRVADPLFTHPFRTGWQYEFPILLVWTDHVEIRWVHEVSEVSPRAKGESYTFNVEPSRQAWVERQVRNTPSPNGNAAWIIHVKQLGPSKQRIQLELLGDGIIGTIYEARPEEIVPLRLRAVGPGGAFAILAAQLLVWGGFWVLVSFVRRRLMRGKQQSTANL